MYRATRANATFDDQIAYGGGANQFNSGAGGGNGGAKDTLGGTAGVTLSGPGTVNGYGGGGSTGRIRVNTFTGTPNVNPAVIVSPTVASGGASYAKVGTK